ncbi:tetraacyldisaccharide 4'-kinase [Aquamicrobium sp. LC103]|uniref:tetraacyldisaccharide 4'-kinase n=1 Tax=Aquamicrobium sp. LC103 TaxID=1120658 RepID=UPI00063E9A33|nr:tetraacyldisaccharide 4'-kinase [Aquamicrobium sp. LC103]TKT69191.1 tetraacyldisaccharide 4'-kinase [Aquamicrobium sp. LC103]
MVSEAPPFWWQPADWRALALYPFSTVYGMVARRRLLTARREKIDLPVLCVGNLTVGGSGKTPVAIALAREAQAMGFRPGFLSRGHGGSLTHPHIVDAGHDIARHVGDEPLLLARQAPVAVTPDRIAGAHLLAREGCDFIIMDDGFQSARVHIDYALIVVDARRGIGNGHTIPGGPMRATLVDQMRYADALLKMGEGDAADLVIRYAARAGRPIFEASARPHSPAGIAGRDCLAFAGIGEPEKFFDTVSAVGGRLAVTKSFADHHYYSEEDIDDLAATADAKSLQLVTTAKDAVRLDHGSPKIDAFRKRLEVIEIDAVFEPETSPHTIIGQTIEAFRRRSVEAR